MPAWILPAAMAVGSLIGNMIQQRKQNKENRKLAETQNTANQAALDKQLEYNTPQNQMQRFMDARLNPNLIYGQGSPGNQSEPLRYPDIKPTQYQNLQDVLPLFNQTSLAQSQVSAQNAQTRRTGVLTELDKLKTKVMEKNPLLDKAGFDAIISSLVATAEGKVAESGKAALELDAARSTDASGNNLVYRRMFEELQLLEQRFRLGEVDAKIKAQVLNSKEFQNAILEVQKKFMTEATITPQHILTFVQLLLMKIL